MASSSSSSSSSSLQPAITRSVTSPGSRHALPLFVGVHEWVILSFADRTDKPGESLYTRFIIPVNDHEGNKVNTVWRIKLYPNGYDQENAHFLSLFINQVSGPSFFVRYTFSINGIPPYNSAPVAQHIRTGTVQFIEEKRTSSCGWKRYISTHAVKQNPTFTQFSNLVIACKLELEFRDHTVINGKSHLLTPITSSSSSSSSAASSTTTTTTTTTLSSQAKLKKEFDLNDIKYTDLILECENGIQFKCHKFMMAKHSDVFDAMFSHNFSETQSNRVVITDLDPDAVAEMIRFVYSGTVKGLKWINKHLFVAADKYNIRELKKLCEKSLVSSITAENACWLLIFANDRLSDFIKKEAIHFITYNIEKVCKTEGWNDLVSKTNLVTQVILEMRPK